MVMAGNENVPGTLADDALSARLQWLRQRREALQEKLAQKNDELRNVCVEEAEITGVLPPEIPLEPGESLPTFHRKTSTALIYPQKLNKLKTTDVEESELELERQVQLGIVETALGIVNDPTESKATRRKHRLAYQQSQRRLQELETELNFIRQSRGKAHRSTFPLHAGNYNTQLHSHINIKHRTKKPRPPLDITGNEVITPSKSAGRGILHEPGISLSPLGPPNEKCVADKPSTYSELAYEEQPPTAPSICSHRHHSGTYPGISPVDQSNKVKIVEHDHNDNHNVYILPEQFRARTYSHGSGGSRGQSLSQSHCSDIERNYRLYVPNTYTDDERLLRYRQLQHLQKQQHLQDQILQQRLQYSDSTDHKHFDNVDVVRRSGQQGTYERDFRTSHYTPFVDYQVTTSYYKNSAQSQQQSLQRRDRDSVTSGSKTSLRHTSGTISTETQLPSGYWIRQNDDIHWVCIDDPTKDRFGSLDRRKRNNQHNAASVCANPDGQSRYRTIVAGTKSSPSGNITSLSHQHHSVHLLPLSEQQIPASNKMLLRTQSLGSVETWQSSHSHDSHDGKDAPAEYASNRKSRQKEWYETSLDSGASADRSSIAAHKNVAHYQSSPPAIRVKAINNDNRMGIGGASISPVNRQKRDKQTEIQHTMQQSRLDSRYDQSLTRPKVLEIPAESKPSVDVCDDAIRPLNSPQSCTVVQPGKYQPYREVTKPFEMSDFYKYSTKFRKRNEIASGASQSQVGNDSSLQENRPLECSVSSNDISRDSNPYNLGQNGNNVTASPVQRRLYQPVQRMTCQPYLSSLR